MQNTDEIIERMCKAAQSTRQTGLDGIHYDIYIPITDNDRRCMKAALEASGLLNQWRDIAEAPMDGTDFLAYDVDVGMYNARYLRAESRFGYSWNEGEILATHFMPLPSQPTTGASDD